MNTKTCCHCDREISNACYARHENSCLKNLAKDSVRAKLLNDFVIVHDEYFSCKHCNFTSLKAGGILVHANFAHLGKKTRKGILPWNAGKTHVELLGTLRAEEYSKKISSSLTGKEWRANNPIAWRLKISEGMKLAHAEGRASNWSKYYTNEPSWPEAFFMKVIANDFQDKNFQREVPFYKFRLDFCWLHKKKVIEIDGAQHERCEIQMRRDKEKDALLLADGFELMRIKWVDMFHFPEIQINKAKQFIDGMADLER